MIQIGRIRSGEHPDATGVSVFSVGLGDGGESHLYVPVADFWFATINEILDRLRASVPSPYFEDLDGSTCDPSRPQGIPTKGGD